MGLGHRHEVCPVVEYRDFRFSFAFPDELRLLKPPCILQGGLCDSRGPVHQF